MRFQWNHWSLANLPVDALMYDFNDSHALAIPADFSRTVSAMIPETIQGRTSAASPLLQGRSNDPAVTMRYNGPYPPDQDHDYYLHVWGTTLRSPASIRDSGSMKWNVRCVLPVQSLIRALFSSLEKPDF